MTPTISTADAADVPASTDVPEAPPAPPAWAGVPLLPFALWLAFLAIAVVANFNAIRGHGFLWTDRALVQDNALLHSLGGVQRIWAGLFDPSSVRLTQYSPLSQATFFFDRLIWGDRIGGYRFTSCLMHATTALMLWYLLRRLAMPGAIAVALLFVAHPMTVESVGLLTERRTILATLFALAAAFLLLRALGVIAPVAGKKSALPDDPMRLYALGATLLVVGLFAHASIAAVPAVVLLIAWWRRRPIDSTAVAVCLGLLIAGAAMLGLDSRIERARSELPAEQWARSASAAGDLAVRTQIAGRALGFYAAKLAVPFPLMSDYPRWRTPTDVAYRGKYLTTDDLTQRHVVLEPDVRPGSVLDWALPAAALAILATLLALSPRVGRGPFVAVASFGLCLLPLLGFVDIGWMAGSFVADRAAYLASVPFFAAIVATLAPVLLVEAQRTTAQWTLVVVLVSYVALASVVAQRYADPVTFWRMALNPKRGNPRSPTAQMGFATSVLELDPPDLKSAAEAIENARFQRPSDPTVHLRIGMLHALLGETGDALASFNFVIQNCPDDVRGYLANGDLFRRLADLKPTDPTLRRYALQNYTLAAEHDPTNARAQMLLGVTAYDVVARLPDRDPQIPPLLDLTASSFDKSVQSDPYDPDRLVTMARTLIAMGRLADASNLLRSAITFKKDDAEAYELIGEAAIKGSDVRGAEAAIRESIALDDQRAETHLKLGSLLQALGRFDEAKPELSRAIELDPANAEAKSRLAEAEAGVTGTSTTRPAAPTTRDAATR